MVRKRGYTLFELLYSEVEEDKSSGHTKSQKLRLFFSLKINYFNFFAAISHAIYIGSNS